MHKWQQLLLTTPNDSSEVLNNPVQGAEEQSYAIWDPLAKMQTTGD